MNPILRPIFFLLSCAGTAAFTHGQAIILQNATADFSQSAFGDYSVGKAIDGNAFDDFGWAVVPNTAATHTAVFETQSDAGFVGGTQLTFTLDSFNSNSGHNLGRFRISFTTDDRSTFADGLANGGAVTANWVVLDPATFGDTGGATLTKQGDFSILASGTNPNTDIVTVTALTAVTGITGFRLEVIPDASLPSGGSGRYPVNGNFVLSEFTVSELSTPVPEPASIAGCSAALLLGWGCWRRFARMQG